MNEDEESAYGLLVAFPDESSSFVHGFEAGEIFTRMGANCVGIERLVHAENREVIGRLCRRMGYVVDQWQPSHVGGWVEMCLRKTEPECHLRAVPDATLS